MKNTTYTYLSNALACFLQGVQAISHLHTIPGNKCFCATGVLAVQHSTYIAAIFHYSLELVQPPR